MITIETEKIIVRGKQFRKIVSYELLKRKDLPCSYYEDKGNYCHLDTDGDFAFRFEGY